MDENLRQAARLWTTAQPAVSAFVHAVVRDFAARNDVLQDIAVAVMENFSRFDSTRPFVPWALGVARNQVRLYLRKTRRDRLILDEQAINAVAAAFADTPPERLQTLDHLRDCVGRLEGRARQLCDLRYAHDQKPAAIGEVVGMTANSVAKALHRIREQLRQCMERRTIAEGGAT